MYKNRDHTDFLIAELLQKQDEYVCAVVGHSNQYRTDVDVSACFDAMMTAKKNLEAAINELLRQRNLEEWRADQAIALLRATSKNSEKEIENMKTCLVALDKTTW